MNRTCAASQRGARRIAFGFALLVWAFAPAAARASVDGDVRGGYYADRELAYFGGGLVTSMDRTGHWYFNPNLEVAPSGGVDLWSLNGDFHYDFATTSGASWWAGAGPAILIADGDGRDSDTEVGVNVLMGLGARRGEVRPFGQLKTILADDSQLVLTGGIRF